MPIATGFHFVSLLRYRNDVLTCTRQQRNPVHTMKSKGELSPQGFATSNPSPVALLRNAASPASPLQTWATRANRRDLSATQ